MNWLWPKLLLCLGWIPLVIAVYVGLVRRRFSARYSSLLLIKEAVPPSWLHRHLPFLLFVSAVTSLILALGRPVVPLHVFGRRTTIILTLDTSRSMCMRDILPSRMAAAKSSALWFVRHPVFGTQVGVVAFAGFAELVQTPTTKVSLLERSIENLTHASQTAIGDAILTSLDAIAKVDKRVAPSEEGKTAPIHVQPIPPGENHYVPHVIVLLTDGASNKGPSPLGAAQQAAERGVRIYTIGFGTTNNVAMDCWNDDPFGSPGLEPLRSRGSFGSEIDEATLRQIAYMTGGKFYSATSAAELQRVFQDLQIYIALTNQPVEISAGFVALGIGLVMTAWLLSLRWHPLL